MPDAKKKQEIEATNLNEWLSRRIELGMPEGVLEPFLLPVGQIVKVGNTLYKVISSRKNGKVTMKFAGMVK